MDAPPRTWRDWIIEQRTSIRLAFVLRVVAMVISAGLSLFWTRALLRSMGDALYGLFVSFLAVTRLGGLGDLGISGALAVRSGQAIGRGETDQLRTFLIGARSLFLLMIVGLSGIFLALSPWLPRWLGFIESPHSGSLTLLFATGALMLFVTLASGYFHSLLVASGTVTWPILPVMFFAQLGLAIQWWGASAGWPLWLQSLGITAASIGGLLVLAILLKAAHPWLGNLRPIRVDLAVWRDLATTSGWIYLYTLGSAIYAATDRLLINAGFGAAAVPTFLVNSKLCELAVQVISSASFVSLPKITRWIASPDPADRERLTTELDRLRIFQGVLGVAAATIYLAINDWFIRLWLGPEQQAPMLWQLAFAMNLAITTAGDAGIQTAGLCGKNGVRAGGLAIGGTGLLNLGLSLIAVAMGSIAGIAFATVIAQVALVIILGIYTARYLALNSSRLLVQSCALPLAAILASYGLLYIFPRDSVGGVCALLAAELLVIALFAWSIGFRRGMIAYEWRSFSSIFRR